ncbi:MAG TPA: RNA-binding protein [Flavisolibacter sp.]|jgi:RNA recognition motif-containing protein|nr:RNA-binding protein [Flavisolibacter sp.]
MNIQITNLDVNLIESDLRRLFTPFGEIFTIEIVRDKLNNRSSGRAFVDMPVLKEAKQAVSSLHGTVLAGKAIVVTEAASI